MPQWQLYHEELRDSPVLQNADRSPCSVLKRTEPNQTCWGGTEMGNQPAGFLGLLLCGCWDILP